MIRRLLISTAMLAVPLMVAAPADACGIPKHNNPYCPKPTPPPDVCVCPTPVPPTAVPTTAPPPVPAQFSVTPPPVATPVPPASTVATRGPELGPAATGGGPIPGPRLSEYCHYEPSTAQWEIRLSTDADGMVRKGGENPIAPHVCDQHLPLHPPFVQATPESVVEEAQPTVEIVELPPVVEGLPMAEEPVVTPLEITVEVTTEETVTVPEYVPVCVPVQVPTDEPC